MPEFHIVKSSAIGWPKHVHMEIMLEDRKRSFKQLSPRRRQELLFPVTRHLPSNLRVFAGQERDFPQHYVLAIQSRPGLPFGQPTPADWYVFTGHKETEVYSDGSVALLAMIFASHRVTA